MVVLEKRKGEPVVLVERLIDNCIKKDPSHCPGMDEIVQFLSTIMTATYSWEMTFSISVSLRRFP